MQTQDIGISSEEHRAGPRFEEQDYITVTVKNAPTATSLDGLTFMCLSKDLSVHGLQFSAFINPPVNTILLLHITFTRPVRVLNHTARVVWTKATEDATYCIGVEFTDTNSASVTVWKTLVTQLSATAAG
ncbi:MAG: PilZ domain-containing protein [bacterium]